MSRKPIAIAAARRTREPCHAVASRVGGFTLLELLVAVLVLIIVVLMVTQLMNNASAITGTGHKHITTDTQARLVLDRIALDFAQMLKRTDVDYFVKGPASYNQHGHGGGHGWGHHVTGQQGSDSIAFFTQVPGYYPSGARSPISVVAYRVNQSATTNRAYMRLERMGKGLLWNGAGSGCNYPLVFLPVTISSLWPAAVNNNNNYNCNCNNNNCSYDPDYETIGPGVFRFEYYYLLKNGRATDVPWNTDAGHTSMAGIGLGDVEAIGVVIAVIDPAGRALIDAITASTPTINPLLDLASDMADFASARGRGVGNQTRYVGALEADWEATVETVASTGQTSLGSPIPPEAAKAIRIYGHTFDLKTLPTF